MGEGCWREVSECTYYIIIHYDIVFICIQWKTSSPEIRTPLYSGHFAISQICFLYRNLTLNEDTSLYRTLH